MPNDKRNIKMRYSLWMKPIDMVVNPNDEHYGWICCYERSLSKLQEAVENSHDILDFATKYLD